MLFVMAVRSKIDGLLPPLGAEAVKRAAASSRVKMEASPRNMAVAGSCPHCGGKILDREARHGFFDKVMRVVHLRPFRCRRCYHRFYGRT